MGVYIKGMEMPKSCQECIWYYFQGTTCTTPKYYIDSRCKLIAPTQDWYGYDRNGGWVGDDIDPDSKMGYYYYHHCVEEGTRAKQCPLIEVPESHGDLIDREVLIEIYQDGFFNGLTDVEICNAPAVIPASKEGDE